MMGQLTAAFAGEINQYLEAIIGEISLLREGDLAPAVRNGVQAVYEAGLQARGTSERLLACARQQKPQKEWVNFTHLVQETVLLMRRTLLKDQIEIAEDLAPNLPYIKAHAGQLQQVVLNLIQNSRDAIKQVRDAGANRAAARDLSGLDCAGDRGQWAGYSRGNPGRYFCAVLHHQGVEPAQRIRIEHMRGHCSRTPRPPIRRRLRPRGLCGLGTAHQSARCVSA